MSGCALLLTGAGGQLGQALLREGAHRRLDVVGLSSQELDVTKRDGVEAMLARYKPRTVLHCAAYTQVDRAEDEPERCWAVNAGGSRELARACRRQGARMLYVSTDYVFPGTGDAPWRVDDLPAPLNVYGASKLAGEEAVRAALDEHFIVRTSWVFGGQGANFVNTMLRLRRQGMPVKIVADQFGSPTYAADLASTLLDLAATECYGTYHAANEGYCTWYEFACAIFRGVAAMSGEEITIVEAVGSADFPRRAVRPRNSRLDKSSLDKAGVKRLPLWEDALARCLRNEAVR